MPTHTEYKLTIPSDASSLHHLSDEDLATMIDDMDNGWIANQEIVTLDGGAEVKNGALFVSPHFDDPHTAQYHTTMRSQLQADFNKWCRRHS